MKVLHISSAKSWRGGERQLDFLIDGLHSAGIFTYLMCVAESPLSKRCGEKVIREISFGKGLLSKVSNAKKLTEFCKEEHIDIVHAHDSHSHSILWYAYLFFGLAPKSIVHRRLDNPIKSISKSKYNHPSVSKIICVSDKVKEVLSAAITDKKRLTVVKSGVDVNRLYEVRKQAKISTTVLYIAAFTKEKGHHRFLEIAKLLTSELGKENIRFVLLGEGPLLETYKNQYSAYSNIHFEGFVDDLHPYLADADILLHTSIQESLGTSILDGMLYGLPCIAYNIGGIPEIIHHGHNGFLLSKYDSPSIASNHITALIDDNVLYKGMSQNCIDTAKQFDKDKMVSETVDIYHEVLDK